MRTAAEYRAAIERYRDAFDTYFDAVCDLEAKRCCSPYAPLLASEQELADAELSASDAERMARCEMFALLVDE